MQAQTEKQNAYLVALQQSFQKEWEIEENLAELAELASDAGLHVIDSFVQRRSYPEPGTFIGRGKALELAQIVEPEDLVIFDDELTPAQQGESLRSSGGTCYRSHAADFRYFRPAGPKQ